MQLLPCVAKVHHFPYLFFIVLLVACTSLLNSLVEVFGVLALMLTVYAYFLTYGVRLILHKSHTNLLNNKVAWVFILACLLRIGFSLVNYESYDNQLEVTRIIALELRFPDLRDCAQCYHPKFYYWLSASLWQLLALDQEHSRVLISHFVSCLASMGSILVLWVWMGSTRFSDSSKLVVFALVSVNPDIILMSGHIANDAFTYLLSMLTLFNLYLFLQYKRWRHFVYMLLFLFLAGVTKGSAWVIFVVVVCALLPQLITSIKNANSSVVKSTFGLLLLVVLPYLLIVPTLGQYNSVQDTGGSGIFNASEFAEFPDFFEKKQVADGAVGLKSIVDGLLTFRLFDLIQHPVREIKHEHEDSLWTSLYGGHHFVYFQNALKTWTTDSELMKNVGRVIFILALVPLFLLLSGLYIRITILLSGLKTQGFGYLLANPSWVIDLSGIGFITAEVVWVLAFRDSDAMRPVYLYPALMCFTYWLLQGYEWGSTQNAICNVSKTVNWTISCLMVLYLVTITSLIVQISEVRILGLVSKIMY